MKTGFKKICDSASNDQGYHLVGSKDELNDKYSVFEISPGPYPQTIRYLITIFLPRFIFFFTLFMVDVDMPLTKTMQLYLRSNTKDV